MSERKPLWSSESNRITFCRLVAEYGDEHMALAVMGSNGQPVCEWTTYWKGRKDHPEWQQEIDDAKDAFFEKSATKSIRRLNEHEESLYDNSWAKNDLGDDVTTLKPAEIAALKGAAMRTRPSRIKAEDKGPASNSQDLSGISDEVLQRALSVIEESQNKESE